jgi:hypothetical protein
MFNGKKKEQEEFLKAYVEKAHLDNVQVWPIPKDLENWIEIPYDHEFDYMGKIYDIESGEFITCNKMKKKSAINDRKKAYAKRSDPMFIEATFDQTELADKAWRDEVKAIKAEYPIN